MTVIAHGGGLRAAKRQYPDTPEPWIDLSTGINPVPYPIGAVARETWTRLPERDEVQALEAMAATAYGVSDPACVVAAPGVQSLIQLLPALCPAKAVAVLGPTYEEHAARWRVAGAAVHIAERLEAMIGTEVAVLVNPNNPDGRLVALDDLSRLNASARLLVVDESFADVMPPETSFASQAPDRRAIVLRSFGKFFGLAGLRLGFAIAPPDITARLRDALGPWAISGPAIAIGARALSDTSWHDATRARLAVDAKRLDAILSRSDLRVIGGTDLFRLAAHAAATPLHGHLCQHGILTRVFASEQTWIRFGLPGASEDWRRIEAALAKGQTIRRDR